MDNDANFKLFALLDHVHTLILRAWQKELQSAGILTKQVGVLHVIAAMGNHATNAELSRWTLREPHTITGILSRIEKKGLITRQRDPAHKNLIRISLTEAGHDYLAQASSKESMHRIFAVLDGRARENLRRSLKDLRAAGLQELDINRNLKYP